MENYLFILYCNFKKKLLFFNFVENILYNHVYSFHKFFFLTNILLFYK